MALSGFDMYMNISTTQSVSVFGRYRSRLFRRILLLGSQQCSGMVLGSTVNFKTGFALNTLAKRVSPTFLV